MRHVAFLCGIFLILAFTAGAQVNSGPSLLLGSPMPALELATPTPAAAPVPGADPLALGAPPEPEPQGVYGVIQNYNWQAYIGFTHFVFYELPGVTGNLNGFNMSLAYYPHGGHFAGDGEFAAAFAPNSAVNTRIEMGLGGVRYRIELSQEVEIWAHGMVGGAKFLPQTPFGSEGAFAFAAGGGVDFSPHHKRLGFRLQGDMVGTRFFGTHQYNPKVSVGVVYKF
jgi:hypothetical protein